MLFSVYLPHRILICMKQTTLLLFFLFTTFFAFSQNKPDTSIYYVNQSSIGNFNQTNAGISYTLNNSLKFNVVKKSVALNTTHSWVYGEQLNVLSNNDYTSVIDFNLYKTLRHFYYWGLGTYDKSYSLKIENRFQGGIGVGYNAVDRKNLFLNISDGFLVEYSDLYENVPYQTIRNSLRIKFMLTFKDFITLEGTDFFQPSITHWEDHNIKSTTTLTIKLYEWLGLKGSIAYNKLNLTSQENLLCNIGFTIEKYF